MGQRYNRRRSKMMAYIIMRHITFEKQYPGLSHEANDFGCVLLLKCSLYQSIFIT